MFFQGRSSKLISLALVAGFYISAQAATPEAVPGEFVVKLKNANSIQSLSVQGAMSTRLISKSLGVVLVKRNQLEMESFSIAELKKNPAIEYVEPNYIYHALKTPNDPQLGQLWGLVNIGQTAPEGEKGLVGVDINAEKAWDIQTGSDKMLVAVIDTGIDYNLPDLAPNVWTNEAEKNGKTGVDDDNNGYIDDIHGYDFANNDGDPLDDHGHGSHVSGTIGAKGDDGQGIVGVNWNVRIMGVKFLTADGSGSLEGAVSAIDYAIKNGAKILSNSWGGGPFSQALADVIKKANDSNILVVAAAGNASENNDEVEAYPANYPGVLAVAAIDNNARLANFSSYGRTKVAIAAPGVKVLSSTPDGYKSWSGTSMATPHVSGVAALLWANEPELTAVQVKERITKTARPIAALRGKVSTGGMVDAYAALTNTTPPPDPNDPELWKKVAKQVSSPHPYADESNLSYTVKVSGAKRFSVFFQTFETESGYDVVTFVDKTGATVGTWSGSHSGEWSPIITGDTVTIKFTSDKSVVRNGFDITQAAYESKKRKDPWDRLLGNN